MYEVRVSEQTSNQQQPVSRKKSYKKPSFRQEKVFETMALTCGKLAGTQGQCSVGSRSAS
jgi:hypothetical protein